jgi:tetratricopeptide (TPR) repeat protein
MQKRWSKAELSHLKRHASSQSVEELAQRFRVDVDTVRRKLEELGLGQGGRAESQEEILQLYTQALERLHESDWEEAATLFQKVVESSDNRQIADRARQNLSVCQQRTAQDEGTDDPYLQAVYEKNRGNVDTALEICSRQGKEAEERYAYLLASLKALRGETEEALSLLRTAIALEPKNRIHAYHDPDFDGVRGGEGFAELFKSDS